MTTNQDCNMNVIQSIAKQQVDNLDIPKDYFTRPCRCRRRLLRWARVTVGFEQKISFKVWKLIDLLSSDDKDVYSCAYFCTRRKLVEDLIETTQSYIRKALNLVRITFECIKYYASILNKPLQELFEDEEYEYYWEEIKNMSSDVMRLFAGGMGSLQASKYPTDDFILHEKDEFGLITSLSFDLSLCIPELIQDIVLVQAKELECLPTELFPESESENEEDEDGDSGVISSSPPPPSYESSQSEQ